MKSKQEIRRLVRQRKREMAAEEIAEKSAALAATFLATDAYRRAKTIYGYLPFNQEVRTLPILEQALRDGKQVTLPKCKGDEMRFILVDDLGAVAPSAFGAPEPIADGPVASDAAALVLMPGVAFDRSGHRIGYGGGYYDRFLACEPEHPTIALCFDFQVFDHLETDAHDVPVNLVLWT